MWFESDDYESRYAARNSFKYTGAQETRLAVRWKNSGVLARHAAVHIVCCNIYVYIYLCFPSRSVRYTYNKQQCSVKHNNHIACYLLTLGEMCRFPWNHHQAFSEKYRSIT